MNKESHVAFVSFVRPNSLLSSNPKAEQQHQCGAALTPSGMKVCPGPTCLSERLTTSPAAALHWPANVNTARLNYHAQKVPRASSHIYLYFQIPVRRRCWNHPRFFATCQNFYKYAYFFFSSKITPKKLTAPSTAPMSRFLCITKTWMSSCRMSLIESL